MPQYHRRPARGVVNIRMLVYSEVIAALSEVSLEEIDVRAEPHQRRDDATGLGRSVHLHRRGRLRPTGCHPTSGGAELLEQGYGLTAVVLGDRCDWRPGLLACLSVPPRKKRVPGIFGCGDVRLAGSSAWLRRLARAACASPSSVHHRPQGRRGCARASRYSLKPPETSMCSPVIQPQSSDSRAAITLPMSSPSPRRPSAVRSTSEAMTSGKRSTTSSEMNPVRVGPGRPR